MQLQPRRDTNEHENKSGNTLFKSQTEVEARSTSLDHHSVFQSN